MFSVCLQIILFTWCFLTYGYQNKIEKQNQSDEKYLKLEILTLFLTYAFSKHVIQGSYLNRT